MSKAAFFGDFFLCFSNTPNVCQWPQMAALVSKEAEQTSYDKERVTVGDESGLKCIFWHANLNGLCSHQIGALSLKSFSEAWMTRVLSLARMLAPRKKPTSQ